MKKSLFLPFACLSYACLILSSLAGCQKTEIPPVDEPEEPYINVSPGSLSFGNLSGESALLTIETNGGWATDIAEDWVTVERVNDMTLKVNVLENGLEEPQRTALLNIVPDNGADTVGVEITQDAGYTIDGPWRALKIENSKDLTNWSTGTNYATAGLEIYYILDLENSKLRMIMNDSNSGESLDEEYDITSYDPGSLTFSITSGSENATYTIWAIDDTRFEFYSWSDFFEAYQKVVCERVSE